ncbi:MAG: YlbF family regulator [Candidatus Atribacteria bacterium]|nr:YlbF family regulator [Candidatus Atribacteria bacterium]
MSHEVKDAARSLAELIMATQLFRDFESSREILTSNLEAMSLLRKLEEAQTNLNQIAMQREVTDEDFAEMEQVRQRAFANPVILSYFQAQDRLVSLLQEVNGEMSSVLGFDFAQSAAQLEPEPEEEWE